MVFSNVLKKVFGSRNERLLGRYRKTCQQINALESEIAALPDEALKQKTQQFKNRVQQGSKLDDLLPEAFAVVREVAKRQLNMRHFDVQLIGGMVLHEGKIAEMRTGEGKTLMATLPVYLNALSGHGVHIVTVNDYLAKRDAEWMSPIYEALGLSVGVVIHGMNREEKQASYACDVIYGTNNEFGFDYLRDNMAFSLEERTQKKLSFAIVDEVDSILIDEARTPLIISGQAEDSSNMYVRINKIIPKLTQQPLDDKEAPGDFSIDEKAKQAFLTEAGHETVEKLLTAEGLLEEGDSLYDPKNIALMHHVYAALKANALFRKDVDYIIKNNQVVIVDEHTGRTMEGRRWSDGLHQAVEAKEGVRIQNENQTLASITFQNYFRLYDKLAGMTGTADTEAYEFQQIYNLEVVVIPTNKPSQRKDLEDYVYVTPGEKFEAIFEDITDCIQRGQPALVGTISIETSEFLSAYLKKKKVPHQVLNAKFHEKEAEIIAEAGRPGTITIATNMAGRGTDIVLGGNLEAELKALGDEATAEQIQQVKADWKERHDKVLAAGGLHIIGTERHESRRIDNQLRGRSGRQGDPGSSRFYLSIQDNLLRIFISEKIVGIIQKLGSKHGEVITNPVITRAVENAQRKVEGHNFDVRKQLLEFDDVANDQRKVIYEQREDLMEEDDISQTIRAIRQDVIDEVLGAYIPPGSLEEQWDVEGLMQCLEGEFGQRLDIKAWLEADHHLAEEDLKARILAHFSEIHEEKIEKIGEPALRQLEKMIMLNVLDTQWKDHLAAMDYLRQSIHLRGYAQKDPKQEYKREAFGLFTAMLEAIKRECISMLAMIQVRQNTDVEAMEAEQRKGPAKLNYHHASAPAITENSVAEGDAQEGEQGEAVQPFVRNKPKVGRNDPCPCGSGRKYKHCHGKITVHEPN